MDAATRQQQLHARMAPNNNYTQQQQQQPQQPAMAAPAHSSQSPAHAPSRSSSTTAAHAAAPAGSGTGSSSSSSSSSMSAEHARSFHSAFESFCAVVDHEVRRCALDEATASQQQQMQMQQHNGAADAKEHATRLFTAYTQLEMQTDRIAIFLAECERKLLLEMHEPQITSEQVARAQQAQAVAHPPPAMPHATDSTSQRALHGAFVRAQLDALIKRAQTADAEAGAAGRDGDDAASLLNGSDLHASQTSTVAAFATPVAASPSGALLTPNGLMSPHSIVQPLSQSHLTPNSVPGHSPNDGGMAASLAAANMET